MGVPRDSRNLFSHGHIVMDIEDLLEDDGSTSEDEPKIVQKKKKTSGKNRLRNKNFHHYDHGQEGRNKGSKQARRCENLQHLLNLAEKEDIELDFDVYEPSMSVFAELFSEKEKMEAWNNFVNCSEEEQTMMLDRMSSKANPSNSSTQSHMSDQVNDSWQEVEDLRAKHPAFSAKQCFQRLDKNIRVLLQRRHLPLGMLAGLEEEVVNFFTKWPTYLYICQQSSSYERMILHGVCQYLDLSSQSYDDGKARQTVVENKRDFFFPPSTLLSEYLKHSKK
ncbi:hypothetical protein CHS0354_025764 [Potamilus streckersoni]|uniref:R3H domain-containing protein n=1 Tax=Potamilus streckersoni TaxID=2493646 RepID=A0AAE0RUP3_9BIVA|nr:hypothetical protein CHS0354_025764 [Potamilus streckersoni]